MSISEEQNWSSNLAVGVSKSSRKSRLLCQAFVGGSEHLVSCKLKALYVSGLDMACVSRQTFTCLKQQQQQQSDVEGGCQHGECQLSTILPPFSAPCEEPHFKKLMQAGGR